MRGLFFFGQFFIAILLHACLCRRCNRCHALPPSPKTSTRTLGATMAASPCRYRRDDGDNCPWNSPREQAESATMILSSHRTRTVALRGGDSDNSGSTESGGGMISSALSRSAAASRSIRLGYRRRIAADPSFRERSIVEAILAVLTQFAAEVSRRGWDRLAPELDFVFAGILTALAGKYYSMWRVAKTVDVDVDDADAEGTRERTTADDDVDEPPSWRDGVPNNAFQETLLDGVTKPTPVGRCLAFVVPAPELFRAGVIASAFGYGLTSALSSLRSLLVPHYNAPTAPVSVPLAAIYTGAFMAVVSNVRYQVLQGIVEPRLIDGLFEVRGFKRIRRLRGLTVVGVRWANGLLGSWLAIGGMRACGLQRLKQ